jgi:DNA-binding response OmpR family regulator
MHILIVEDDDRIAKNIKKILESDNFKVTIAANGEDGLYQAVEETYDVIILDWMLPDQDGITICKKIRQKKNTTPIIILTAKSQLENKIEGLNVGADDYLTKPFEGQELLARVKALIRRQSGRTQSPVIKIGHLEIDTNTTIVKMNRQVVNLAPKEYALLEYLAVNKGRVIDRMTLLHHVWGEDIDEFSNTIDVHIRYLRQKIDDNQEKKLIRTVKNKGYMLCD